MARIRREYDDRAVLDALQNTKGLEISDSRWIDSIDVDPPIGNSDYRIVNVSLKIPLTTEEFNKVFSHPVD